MNAFVIRIFKALAFVALLGCEPTLPQTVALPTDELGALEPAVRDALTAARATFDGAAAAKPDRARLASAWGELGMSYEAQDVHGQALVCYRNAALLAPDDAQWQYLLGLVASDAGRLDEAIAAFAAALQKAPDSATRIRLGQAQLQAGHADLALALFEDAAKDPQARAAALAGLGKAALAQGRAREAADALEEALKLWPTATRLHQPLAMAYRALNDETRAAEQLRLHVANGLEPAFPDPLVEKLRGRVAGSRVFMARGARAAAAGRYDLAEEAFREAVKADPRNSEAQSNLGSSIANQGRNAEARKALEAAIALDARNANAQFGLAVLYDRDGLERLAIDHYERAAALDADNMRARFFLADAHMRGGRAGAAIALYKEVIAKNPADANARVALALALVRERKWREARTVLEDGFDGSVNDLARANALARILAGAPDAAVRDGPRALDLAKRAFEAMRTPETGQTYAMAMAEAGDFERAVSLQQAVLALIERQGASASGGFVRANLALYQKHVPARLPWPADHPDFSPRRVQPVAARTAPAPPG
jgi:tetratricopeptide (TPR) repeat protein